MSSVQGLQKTVKKKIDFCGFGLARPGDRQYVLQAAPANSNSGSLEGYSFSCQQACP